MSGTVRSALAAILFALMGESVALAQPAASPPPTDVDGIGNALPPQTAGATNGDPDPNARPEPQAPPIADPLAIAPEVAERIGSDAEEDVDTASAKSFILPPFYINHVRPLPDPAQPLKRAVDRQSLYGLFYYQRRSPTKDADILFPLVWRFRDDESHLVIAGPWVNRTAPDESDHWLAPIFFQGTRKDGGYFHSPVLLTTSHSSASGAFTLSTLYFRNRTEANIDLGVVPFVFYGDNGDLEGARRTYTLIPPLIFFHREREVDESTLTVAGPVVVETNPKRTVVDILPLFYSIYGKPTSGGTNETHITLFPFFHWGQSPEQALFAAPGVVWRITPTTSTVLTPFYSNAKTRNGATSLTAIGPVVPLFWRYTDRDIDFGATAVFPFVYASASPKGTALLTPLFGRFSEYGVSRTWWFLPTFTFTQHTQGWSANLHPLLYFGRDGGSKHSVVAPIVWDFSSPKGRSTVGFPLFWRFTETATDQVTQVVVNTLYMQRRVSGGLDWQFHVLPIFSYGENPKGYFWNILFGLAGYKRSDDNAWIKALWLPIRVAGAAAPEAAESTQ